MKKRPVLVIFLIVQLIGILCLALWQRAPSALGAPMWGAALIALFLGNFLGGWIVDSLFWRSHLSLVSMGILSTMLSLVIDSTIWFAVVKAVGVGGRYR